MKRKGYLLKQLWCVLYFVEISWSDESPDIDTHSMQDREEQPELDLMMR
jgi:hypothetical protein